MARPIAFLALLVLLVAAADPSLAQNREAKKAERDIHALHLEVTALEVMSQLQLTRSQLEQLAKLAPRTAAKENAEASLQGSEELHKALTDLSAALVADEEDRIADLSAKLEDLRDKEQVEAPEVEITAAARQQTPSFLRTLGARQVALYLADYAEDFPDPADKLSDALEEVRQMKGEDADRFAEDVAAQVGWLVAGLNGARAEVVATQARALLKRAQRLSEDDFKKSHGLLEKAVHDLAGKVEPTDVLRHFVERTLAELLSNPRLGAVVRARLEKSK